MRTRVPGVSLSVSSFLLTTALNGKPFAKPCGNVAKSVDAIARQNDEQVKTHLRQRKDIRLNTALLDHKHLPRPPKSTLHLVDDQQDVVLVADLPKRLEKLRRCRDVAAFADERLDEDGSGVFGAGLLSEEERELIETVGDEGVDGCVGGDILLVPVREWDAENAGLSWVNCISYDRMNYG